MRVRLRGRCVALCGVMVVLFLLVSSSLYWHLSNRQRYMMDASPDALPLMPHAFGLGLPQMVRHPEQPKRPMRNIPQLHVKTLPQPVVHMNMTEEEAEDQFFRYLENKDVRCANDKRLGHQHDGGWNVCLSPPFSLLRPCVVLSIGIGRDWQFDDAVSKIYGCQVLAYDPSIVEMKGNTNPLIHFRQIGIGASNLKTAAGWRLKTLGTIIRDEELLQQRIQYLKIDIEYSEWEVLAAIYREGSLRRVEQFGIEIHSRELFHASSIDLPTHKPDFVRMYNLLRPLEERFNFRKFNYRRNPFGDYKSNLTGKVRSCCYELHYLNMNLVNDSHVVYHYGDNKIFH